MKKWAFWLVILALLGYEAYQQKSEVVTGNAAEAVQSGARQVNSQGKDLSIKVSKDQIYQGNLVLVNNDYPVRQGGMRTDVVELAKHKELIQGFGLSDNSIRLSQDVVRVFTTMVSAAQKDGVRHFMINSGYRDNKEQDQLYKQMGADYALPAGYSEHNLGLALDIGSSQGDMNQAAEGRWLINHASEYGFILRYPKDKTAITGIQYEPWHFRYVGLPHSVIMQQHNFTLEEYMAYLKDHNKISSTVKGKKYEIAYYPVSKSTSIPMGSARSYEISGNNMDGVIVTVAL
ncbi:M15 family metallopeptidase [Bacillus sp. 3255]|uniref:M15 family metallopeptidase n=1 Tax=Bacillus sp. 3255 TaxID=2817904 RepID=UPI002866F16F|nr:M15 family metallopeptidase [Bacillus sp. 3255]MDR6883299.1 D-alanyl-D-alanine carboxypeptidase [Bacillus sp. 3255]